MLARQAISQPPTLDLNKYYSCVLSFLSWSLTNLQLTDEPFVNFYGREKIIASHLHFTVVWGKCKRSVFCFPSPHALDFLLHLLLSSMFLYLSIPHPTPFSPSPPTHSPAQHSFTSKIKHTSILFQEFQHFSAHL